jgi:hypothetical protein
MTKVYIVRKGDLVIGIYDDLQLLSTNLESPEEVPKFSKGDKTIEFGRYTIEQVNLNEDNVKPNKIIFKGKEFNLNNLEDSLPLLDVSDPSYL